MVAPNLTSNLDTAWSAGMDVIMPKFWYKTCKCRNTCHCPAFEPVLVGLRTLPRWLRRRCLSLLSKHTYYHIEGNSIAFFVYAHRLTSPASVRKHLTCSADVPLMGSALTTREASWAHRRFTPSRSSWRMTRSRWFRSTWRMALQRDSHLCGYEHMFKHPFSL